jgi:RHS repeat-associated protein
VPLNAELGTNLGCTGPSGDTAANDQDQLCEYGGFSYAYNARGQLQNKSDGVDTTTYTYDGLGRLKRVTEPGMDIDYVHDALGRRIGKIRDGNLEKGWLYADALNPIAQLDSSGNVEATFVYGSRAHVPDAMVMTDGTVYRLITDHLGSVRLVVNAETGQVVQRMDYDAFGRVLNAVNPNFRPFGFAGGLYDDDTGLVRFGARDYDAYSGRWTAKDPILFGGGDENLYAYAGRDPINYLDPDGRLSVSGNVFYGPGGGFTIGWTECDGWFYLVRVGFGLGVSLSVNPTGGLPVTRDDLWLVPGEAYGYVGIKAQVGVSAGPIKVGYAAKGGVGAGGNPVEAKFIEQSGGYGSVKLKRGFGIGIGAYAAGEAGVGGL